MYKSKENVQSVVVEINIYGTEEPTLEGINLIVSTYDTTDIIYVKKRNLRGNRRKNVIKEISEKTTYTWRREKANGLMKFGDLGPAHLYSEEVLRKAKQQYREELGVSKEKDLILSIKLIIKYNLEFAGCIHEIGMNKFFTLCIGAQNKYLCSKNL